MVATSFKKVGKNVKGLSWLDTPQEISDECYQDALVIVTDTANQPRVDDDRYTKGKFLHILWPIR